MKLKTVRKLRVEKQSEEVYAPVVEPEEEERDTTTLDMTGWEDSFDYSSMKGLFFIQKGQFSRRGLCVTVKEGAEYDERQIGGYNPYSEETEERYCVIDRVTFNTIYGGSSLLKALECIERMIINCNNDPEKYFKYVCEGTNDDFYDRHYLGGSSYSPTALKKRAEDGRCWRSSPHTRRSMWAVYKIYGDYYKDLLETAEEKAVNELERRKKERLEKRKNRKCAKVRKLKRNFV